MDKEYLEIYLINPRGFCAGVSRAIEIVETALEVYEDSVYVKHEIVHNKFVVDGLRAKGAIFVEDLSEIPAEAKAVIFSAHGVAKNVLQEAENRGFNYIDATCPLVSKVHRLAWDLYKKNKHVILVGHKGHPEVIGTMGQLPKGAVSLVSSFEDVDKLKDSLGSKDLSCITQTTLSIDDTKELLIKLKQVFPQLQDTIDSNICYATTNRQNSVKSAAKLVEAILVLGAPNSSNSNRLVEVAKQENVKFASLVERAELFDFSQLKGYKKIAITAGASAPEQLVKEVLEKFSSLYDVKIINLEFVKENTNFIIPSKLLKAKKNKLQ